MKAFSLRVIALASIPAFGACADTGTTSEEPQGFQITVAPLQLDGIGDACYDITVSNGTDDVVALTGICASQYGNTTGGDITYIAPCDSTVDSDATQDGVQNSVTVWPTLHSAAPGTGANELTDWEDPCGTAGCTLHADCDPNADTLVEFNFTIMRDAQQGFFDIAVNFNNIFCSAKLDTCYEAGNATTEIELLHGATGREHTAVAAVACTAGPDSAGTTLVFDGPSVVCDQATFNLDLTGADGGNETVQDTTATYTLDYAVYFGSELLACDGTAGDCEKTYYNIAINLETLQEASLTNCRFNMIASAVETGSSILTASGLLADPNGVYPGIVFDESGVPAGVALTGAGGDGLCVAHPLNGGSSSVNTVYLSGSNLSSGNGLTFDGDFMSVEGAQATAFAP